jgi:hypothetical protein
MADIPAALGLIVEAVPHHAHQRSALYVCWDLRTPHDSVEDAQHQHPNVVVPYRIHDPSCAGAHQNPDWGLAIGHVAVRLQHMSECHRVATAEALQRLVTGNEGRQGRTDCCTEDRLEHEHQRRHIHMEVREVWVNLGLRHGSNDELGRLQDRGIYAVQQLLQKAWNAASAAQ